MFDNNKTFELNRVAYSEMFELMKENLVTALSEYVGEEILARKINIEERNCFTRSAFGSDGDLYQKVKLDIYVGNVYAWMLIFNPYEISLVEYDGSEKEYRSNALDNCLIDMMIKLFPDSNYLVKREKYFKDAKINKKVSDMLMGNV